MSKPKVAVVVPSNRPERLAAWWDAWLEEFTDKAVYTVHDNEATWLEMPSCFSSKTDGIRCYGFLKALRDGADIIITLDDDVVPAYGGVLQQHVDRLLQPAEQDAWMELVGFRTRGIPFRQQHRSLPCAVSHGLWLGTPDLDAPTQLTSPGLTLYDKPAYNRILPAGSYAPLSAMNLAFTRSIAPAFFFPPMATGCPDHGYDRFGDIWAGIIAKKICDHLRLAVHSGSPWVRHERASDPFTNLIKEAKATKANEEFWRYVDSAPLRSSSVAGCVLDIADHLGYQLNTYCTLLSQRLREWIALLPEDLQPR